jgi:hypothetical protein
LAALWAELAFEHTFAEIGTRLAMTTDGQALVLELDRRFGYTHHEWSEANLTRLLATVLRPPPALPVVKTERLVRTPPPDAGTVMLTAEESSGGHSGQHCH